MAYGIETSEKGYDLDPKTKIRGNFSSTKKPIDELMIWPLAIAYLRGAKIQLVRYQSATSILEKNAIEGVLLCLHETSCLFEDLATISIYLKSFEKVHEYSDQFITIRNHIRHDVRENLDKKNKKVKIKRLERLKMKEHLQMDISFDPKYIKVGETKVTIDQIKEFLKWADNICSVLFEQGKRLGRIKIDNIKSQRK